MKIVDRKTFLAMPEGTVYCPYEPSVFGCLSIKSTSSANDFVYLDLSTAIRCTDSFDWSDKLDDSLENGTSLEMDFEGSYARDGAYVEDELYAVWEAADVQQLINLLQAALLCYSFQGATND